MNRWMIIATISLVLGACQEEHSESNDKDALETVLKLQKINGEAQGSTYHISYYSAIETIAKQEVDSILQLIDASLSTYDSNSLITALNAADSNYVEFDDYNNYFSENIRLSRQVYLKTGGAFDPTVAPLVNGWGFGFGESEEMTQQRVDSILQYVGFDYDEVRLSKTDDRDPAHPGRMYYKKHLGTTIDFNAIAQGFSVDVLADYFVNRGVTRYMIELGGEVKVGDAKPDGKAWNLGVDKPKSLDEARELQAVLQLSNTAVATSGNYRKFYLKDGKKLAHTIDPRTGYPVDHTLLSTTVIHPNCALADAYATAFMVMGMDQTKNFLETNDLPVEVYLIYEEAGDLKTWMTAGVEAILRK